MAMDLDAKIAYYNARGWAPVSYRHLHPDLKQLIRKMRFRPSMKQCFRNTQYIMAESHRTSLEARLKLDGVIQDPTITKEPGDYLTSNQYSAVRIRHNLIETRQWCPVDFKALRRGVRGVCPKCSAEEALRRYPD